ncbi:unnamed protein product [Rotaria sordida]|uniref:Uncharacterized protein n=2 Tax=Rotaria sordida TaxID=392033 RepID=A0A819EK98_9BILA|nr:unnamed protein product [Rotaria sordida]
MTKPDHRTLNCPKQPQQQHSTALSHQKNNKCIPDVQDVIESNRHDLIKETYAINGRVIPKKFSNGIKSYIDQTLVDFALKLDDFNNKITSPYVFPVKSEANHDLLLDLSWLFKNNPHIDWKTRIITITTSHQKYT